MTHREEPGKQKTRRRRARELSRSCAQKNAWRKWNVNRIRPSGVGGRPELRVAAYVCAGLEIAPEWKMAVVWGRVGAASTAQSLSQGGPLLSQLGIVRESRQE